MLWQRIATALVLIPLVVAGLLLLDTAKVAIVFGLVLLLGAAEMARLAGLTKFLPIAVYVAVVGVLLWLAWDLLVPQLRTSMQWIIATWCSSPSRWSRGDVISSASGVGGRRSCCSGRWSSPAPGPR